MHNGKTKKQKNKKTKKQKNNLPKIAKTPFQNQGKQTVSYLTNISRVSIGLELEEQTWFQCCGIRKLVVWLRTRVKN